LKYKRKLCFWRYERRVEREKGELREREREEREREREREERRGETEF